MAALTKLPSELLQNILKWVDPSDLASLYVLCTLIHNFINNNTILIKNIYSIQLDTVAKQLPTTWNWEAELRNFTKFRGILQNNKDLEPNQRIQDLIFVSNFITLIMRISPPNNDSRNLQLVRELFGLVNNIPDFFCCSTTFKRTEPLRVPTVSFQQRQASAKLHVYYGVAIQNTRDSRYEPEPNLSGPSPAGAPRTRSHRTWPYAASMVYDLGNYKEGTLWGPYLDDGQATADWEKIEAVMIDLWKNVDQYRTARKDREQLSDLWVEPWHGVTPNSFQPRSLKGGQPPLPPVNLEDPYNISGTWLRIVCFLDFHDLFHFNFDISDPSHMPRAPMQAQEAFRLIIMELEVTKIEPPGPDDGQDLPVVSYKGTARSLHQSWDPNTDSTIAGSVSLTKEGEVRWTGVSIYDGEERWRTEGIQIGGPNSARGVLGHWFDKDRDLTGPAGPTAYWKLSNEQCPPESGTSTMHPSALVGMGYI